MYPRRLERWFRRLCFDVLPVVLKLARIALEMAAPSRYAGRVSSPQVSEVMQTIIQKGNGGTRWLEMAYAWERADELWRIGQYRGAVELRAALLGEAYALQGVDEAEYVPPVMSAGWVSHIGHLGWLAMFSSAQSLGLVSGKARSLLIGPSTGNPVLLRWAQESFAGVAPVRASSVLTEWPSLWPLSERLQMVRGPEGFIDSYQLWEMIFERSEDSPGLFRAEDDLEYFEDSARSLEGLGLPRSAPFVAVHIRDAPQADIRLAPPETFRPAVEEASNSGFFVVKFGPAHSGLFDGITRVIDLAHLPNGGNHLHPYLLTRAGLLITTASGPSTSAWMAGTPVLQTNVTSIGRNLCRARNPSCHLPKHVVGPDGREWSLSEILTSPAAYSEPSVGTRMGFSYRFNSATEILNATCELLAALKGQDGREMSVGFDTTVETIRQECGAISHGSISASFLESQGRWYLS